MDSFVKNFLKNKKAYLSGLGSMGRKHLKGLIKLGCIVEIYDKKNNFFDIVKNELKEEGLNYKNIINVEYPSGKYDFAIFSETAPSRLKNFQCFLEKSYAKKILLEKPLSPDPSEFNFFLKLAKENKIEKQVNVNFIRRTWPHIKKIFEYCSREHEFTMTVNGGAIGLGCNGIHYIDNFIFFSNNQIPKVKWVKISDVIVKSGRGEEFSDFGGNFILETSKGTLMASISSNSSTNVVMSIKGKHFMITVDYENFSWKIARRKSNINLPLYRYGAEYETIENGMISIPSIDNFIEDWTRGNISLPDLKTSIMSHRCLENILLNGGIKPPYRFT